MIRFLAEAEAVASVRHPNVVEVYSFGETDGHPFLAMEYLPGGSLSDRLRAGRLPPTEAVGVVAAVALSVIASALPARAQQWPTKPVRLVVPFAPGGTTDLLARLIAQKLSESLGQQFYIENQVGAGGNIGMGNAARAAPVRRSSVNRRSVAAGSPAPSATSASKRSRSSVVVVCVRAVRAKASVSRAAMASVFAGRNPCVWTRVTVSKCSAERTRRNGAFLSAFAPLPLSASKSSHMKRLKRMAKRLRLVSSPMSMLRSG